MALTLTCSVVREPLPRSGSGVEASAAAIRPVDARRLGEIELRCAARPDLTCTRLDLPLPDKEEVPGSSPGSPITGECRTAPQTAGFSVSVGLRTFPALGNVVWGARTLAGADMLGSEWKYVPVRRTALFLEESLYRGTKWVMFEPNDEPLWAQIRLNVGAFMHDLFRQGAFQGTTPKDAYLVKCDKETTTQTDINNGILNILIGFAPLKPAEFVIIQIQQLAGQVET
jgi:tail sheath protein